MSTPSSESTLPAIVDDLRKHLAWALSEGGSELLVSWSEAAAQKRGAAAPQPAAAAGPMRRFNQGPAPVSQATSQAPGPASRRPLSAPAQEVGTAAVAAPAPASATPAASRPPGRVARPLAASSAATQAVPAAARAARGQGRSIKDLPKVLPVPEAERRTLDEIRQHIGDCRRCKLSVSRRQIVFGVGNPRAKLVFVGEGPGADEDEQGVPFVGKAGQLLTKMIEAMGFRRDDVYICNVVKCRPPDNRNPELDEIESCEPFLRAQLGAISPQVIVALGKFAAQVLLREETPITRLRGQWREYAGIPLMPTFHPAYLLRNPAEKKAAWSDLQQVMKRFAAEGTGANEEG